MTSDNIVDFARYKKDVDSEKSDDLVTLDLHLNQDSGEVWASASNVHPDKIDAGWNRDTANLLRQLAWLADCEAARMSGEGTPIASINIFEDSRVSTRWNDDLITNQSHVEWVHEQLTFGLKEIKAATLYTDQSL